MLLFYVRHGDPIYAPDSLTELGQKQAELLVNRMKECNPDRIFSSSSNRAVLTAEPTARYLNKPIEILDWCHEGHAFQEFCVKKEDGSRTWCFAEERTKNLLNSAEVRSLGMKWYDYPAFSNTSFKSGTMRVQHEVDKFMRSLGYEHDERKCGYHPVRPNDDRIALFAHQGFGMIFLSCLLDIPYPLIANHFDISHSNMTVIEFPNEAFVIPKVLQLSNDSHLFASDMSVDYCNRIHF